MPLHEATLYVLPDEFAWTLKELDLPPPDYGKPHRYQIIDVIRNDRLVEYRVDLGLSSEHHADQFNIIGGYVDDRGRGHAFHSVAELQEIAEQMRERPADDPGNTIDFEQAFHDEADRRRRLLTA